MQDLISLPCIAFSTDSERTDAPKDDDLLVDDKELCRDGGARDGGPEHDGSGL